MLNASIYKVLSKTDWKTVLTGKANKANVWQTGEPAHGIARVYNFGCKAQLGTVTPHTHTHNHPYLQKQKHTSHYEIHIGSYDKVQAVFGHVRDWLVHLDARLR